MICRTGMENVLFLRYVEARNSFALSFKYFDEYLTEMGADFFYLDLSLL